MLRVVRDRDPLQRPFVVMYVLLGRLPEALLARWIAARGFPGKKAGRPVSAANTLARLIHRWLVIGSGQVETTHNVMGKGQWFQLTGTFFEPGARRIRGYRLA